jgi:hypothetical protein
MWRFIKVIIPTILSAILIWLGTTMNFIVDPNLVIWAGFVCLLIPIFLLNKEIVDARNEKPIIKLKDFGFEIKEWKDSRPSVCAYIDVINLPKSSTINDVNSRGVYPTITWVDRNGDTTQNNGRWWIPNEDQEGAVGQLFVDLDANGLPRRLHFTYSIMQNLGLQALWRSADNKMQIKLRANAPYEIKIFLKDKSLSEATFFFRITTIQPETWPNFLIRFQQLDKSNGKVLGTRNFDLAELHRFEKEKGYEK